MSQTRDVICDTYSLSKEEAFKRAEAFIKENSDRWKLPDPNINYEDPFCRMAYLYMNVAVHATLVEHAIQWFPPIGEVIRKKLYSGEELRVCALGGGPGSELLGIVRYIEKIKDRSESAYLDFLLVDRIKEWDESWHAMKLGIDHQLRAEYGGERSKWPVVISRSFLPLDTTIIQDFENFATRFSGIDIFLVCYLVSELETIASGFEEVLNLLVTRASPQALLLFIDRDEKLVRETVLDMVKRNDQLAFIDLKQDRGRLEDDPNGLGEWYIHIEPVPRQKWLTFCLLSQKTQTQMIETDH